ncbi:hypothetical protein JAAARDRAFT_164069 [Jaapia argillacea MUCL 33604]|uniref:Tetratricopeptide SHNi-TPR domain-containing protein n=1 Tax=Jaapia argillacea MUCL 33604 TaxID=933084 RepID=A0A067PKQ5_9AGAM|nr:hypothetical protein JAAARDRAFT_164069 [Jaapia argillacea MUCL 33604]
MVASSAVRPTQSGTSEEPEMTIESAIDQAKRAFALQKYEQAVEFYAIALEFQTKKFGDNAFENADLYFSYGRALLENAIAQSSVLGKKEQEKAGPANEASGSGSNKNGPILSFSGDAEDEDEEGAGSGQDIAVDLFAEAARMQAADDDEDEDGYEDEEDDGAEPEDDFNAAWEVLDLARALYDKGKDESDQVKLKLADTYIALGDVSLETEKFDQAITDYSEGLALKTSLLPLSSRQIAEAHYKLSMVLDLTSGRLADAIVHAEKALESIDARLMEARLALTGQGKVEGNAKGKAKDSGASKDGSFSDMTNAQIESEIKDLEGLKEDLGLKVDELKTTPSDPAESAPAQVAKELDKELNVKAETFTSALSGPAPVHDLTSMVKKKQKPAANGVNGSGKRKADDGGSSSSGPVDKKPKVQDA